MSAATLARQYDTSRAAAVLERVRTLPHLSDHIGVTAALSDGERALKAGDAERTERAMYGLAKAVRASYDDETAAGIRGED